MGKIRKLKDGRTVLIELASPRVHAAECEGLDEKECFAVLERLGSDSRRLANDVLDRWKMEHWKAGDDERLRAWFVEREAARVAELRRRDEIRKECLRYGKPVPEFGPMGLPKCPVECWPKGWVEQFRKWLVKRFPGMHGRTVDLLLRRQSGVIANSPASSGGISRWQKILCGDGESPATSRMGPLAFDSHSRVQLEMFRDGKWDSFRLSIRLHRIAGGEDSGKSRVMRLTLRTGGKDCQRLRTQLAKVISGEYELRGSTLVYSQSKRAWFAKLIYFREAPKPADADPAKRCFVRPCRRRPLVGRIEGGREFFRIRGRELLPRFRSLCLQRRSRQAAYRQRDKGKGRGRNRAIADWRQKFEDAGGNLKKTKNQVFSSAAVARAVAAGCGTLVWFEPKQPEKLFLHQAGTGGGLEEAGGWPWFQLKTCLESACDSAGIAFIDASKGRKRKPAKKKRRTR